MSIQRNPLKITVNRAEVGRKSIHENRLCYRCGLFAESLPCACYASLHPEGEASPGALTDAVARQVRTTGKTCTLNDSDGLSLLVTARGAQTWRFRFSLQGKRQRISPGSYPALSLQQARRQRDELRAQLAAGNDPRSYRRPSNAAAQNTFDAVFHQWRDFRALSLEIKF